MEKKLKILLTNDDGFDAPGIKILQKQLEKDGHETILVAPHIERSANSHMITLHEPLRIIKKSENEYAVSGTPADCMIIASEHIVNNEKIDVVISGINGGQNLGEDVLYSGTVAAALEACFLGYKSIALSLTAYENQNFGTAAKYISESLNNNILDLIEDREILNINVPNLETSEIKGVKVTQIGHRKYLDFLHKSEDQRGRDIFWIGGNKTVWDDDPTCDAYAVQNDYISITPVKFDFTNRKAFDKIENWLKK